MPTFRTASARQRMPLRAPRQATRRATRPGTGFGWNTHREKKSCPGAGRDIMARVEHLSTAELVAGLSDVRDSPSDGGTVELIVRRPAVGEREVLAEASLDVDAGLAGDTWPVRGSKRTADGSAHPDMQLTVMNSRAALLVA